MRFPGIRLVEQTEKFRRLESALKKQAGNGPSRRHI